MTSRLLLATVVLLLWSSLAVAGRKRVVVLDFEGPKADKFHDDLVKLLKKHHTVISTDKWNGAADELDAGKITEKNIKKVARKLKIDGVVTGKIEKRRDEYIIRLKLRAGTTGELIGNSIDTKADGPRLDGKAQSDLKDELIAQIDDLEANHGGGGDDDDDTADKPTKKKHHGDDDSDDDADAKPSRKKHGDDDSDSDSDDRRSAFSKKSDDDMKGGDKVGKKSKKHGDDDSDDDADAKPSKKKHGDDDSDTASAKHDDDDTPLPKSKRADKKKDSDDDSDSSSDDDDKPKKRVAKKDSDSDDDSSSVSSSSDDDSDTGIDQSLALSPAHRAIDVAAGLSFTGRNLGFQYKSTLSTPPPGYKQAIPVAGGMFDATFYPLAFNKKNTSVTSGIGVEVLFDKALKINSQKRYIDANGAGQVANLATSESRLKIAGVFRYPLGKGAMAPVIGGELGYETRRFSIYQTLPNSDATDVPSVYYTMITPEAFFIYPVAPKMNFSVNAGFLAVTNTGDMQKPLQYGAATVSGFDFSAALDYAVTQNVFVRADGMLQTIGLTFKGNPMSLTNSRDGDPTTQDVTGARDTYFGGAVTIGYLY